MLRHKFFNPEYAHIADVARRLNATMTILPFDIAAALTNIGPAEVLIGSMITNGGLVSIGATEGPITPEPNFDMNNLTAERTGGAVHQQRYTSSFMCRFSLVLGDPTLWPKIHPGGIKGFGFARSQKVAETSMLIIPADELGGGLGYAAAAWTRTAGNGVTGGTGASYAPKNALWLWRCALSFGNYPMAVQDGGKSVVEVTATAMYAGLLGATVIQDGFRLAMIGDPTTLTPALPILL